MDKLKYVLPLPPSVNHMYITTNAHKRVLTREAKDWVQACQILIRAAARRQGWTMSQGTKLVMEIKVFWRDGRRRDMNNLHKLLCDVPEGIVYEDDRFVMVRDMDFGTDRQNSRAEIEIWEATP